MMTFEKRLSALDLAFIARNTSLMLKAGIPVSEAMSFVQDQVTSEETKKIIADIQKDVQAGIKLSKAMQSHEKIFGTLFIQFTRIGEESGNLEETLLYLATQYEREQDTKRKIKAALFYPIIILFIAIVYALVFAFVIFPRLETLFADFQTDLPTITQVVISGSEWLRSWGFLVVIGFVALLFILMLTRNMRGVSKIIDQTTLKIPFVRKLIREFLFARFFLTISYLTKSGIPLAESLHATEDASPNSVIKSHIHSVVKKIEQGKTLSESLHAEKFFPDLSIKLISAAEKSGSLEDTLLYLGTYFERNVDYSTKNIATSIEPLLLIFVGVAVALLAIAIILPIYQFTGAISFI